MYADSIHLDKCCVSVVFQPTKCLKEKPTVTATKDRKNEHGESLVPISLRTMTDLKSILRKAKQMTTMTMRSFLVSSDQESFEDKEENY